jgi:hypothetical protein
MDLLEKWGLLLLQDSTFPNLVGLIAGGPVRGSWWGHPTNSEIFHAAGALDEHPDVATTKLISGKVTFVHRCMWPELIAVGRSREEWQTRGLTKETRALLARVDKETRLQAAGEPAKMLEARLLVASQQVHSGSGAHATELSTWEAFARQVGVALPRLSAARARRAMEQRVHEVNVAFDAKGKLPWEGRAGRARSRARGG